MLLQTTFGPCQRVPTLRISLGFRDYSTLGSTYIWTYCFWDTPVVSGLARHTQSVPCGETLPGKLHEEPYSILFDVALGTPALVSENSGSRFGIPLPFRGL